MTFYEVLNQVVTLLQRQTACPIARSRRSLSRLTKSSRTSKADFIEAAG